MIERDAYQWEKGREDAQETGCKIEMVCIEPIGREDGGTMDRRALSSVSVQMSTLIAFSIVRKARIVTNVWFREFRHG